MYYAKPEDRSIYFQVKLGKVETGIITNWKNDWNKFCIQVNSSRNEIYLFVNDKILFKSIIEFRVNKPEKLEKITFKGIGFLRQAAIYSSAAENIKSGSDGDILPWNIGRGGFTSFNMKDIPLQEVFWPSMLLIPYTYDFKEGVDLCKKLGNAEMVEIKNNSHQKNLLEFYTAYGLIPDYYYSFRLPYARNGIQENFTNIYRQTQLENIPESSYFTNTENCIVRNFDDHTLMDVPCNIAAHNLICNIKSGLILRGTYYNNRIFYPAYKFKKFFWINVDKEDEYITIMYNGSWILSDYSSNIFLKAKAPSGKT